MGESRLILLAYVMSAFPPSLLYGRYRKKDQRTPGLSGGVCKRPYGFTTPRLEAATNSLPRLSDSGTRENPKQPENEATPGVSLDGTDHGTRLPDGAEHNSQRVSILTSYIE